MGSADAWGVQDRYRDAADVERTVAPESVQALHELIGTPPPGLDRTAPLVVRANAPLDVRGEVELEGGGRVAVGGAPVDLPLGYHRLIGDGDSRALIVSPGSCREPDRRAWGWAVQLYAARSARSWGIGDLADLRTLADWGRAHGAGFVLINPLGSAAPVAPQEPSPYLPSSRRFRNPVYLHVPDVPGAEFVDLSAAVNAGRALNERPEIDRDEVWRITRPVLEGIFVVTAPDQAFARWRAEQGLALQEFATWCALADDFGPRWRDWPAEYRQPHTAAVDEYARRRPDTVAFHAWLQWQLSRQLDAVAERTTLVQDLPVGFDPDGADAWAWQDLLAFDATVGAPPDPFNLAGQDWGMPPFVPWRLRRADYRPFIESVRATMASGGGLRIDHVMALYRLWWIPAGADARQGGYVRYPARDLMDIVALESVRAGAIVVGEDLGTVEEGVRQSMHDAGMLSYRLLWFEDEPQHWPVPAMAAVSTHDLPTVAGLWSGVDLEDQRASGVEADEASTAALRTRLGTLAELPGDAAIEDAVAGAYRALAAAPSTLLTASLDDAAAAPRRPNIPGAAERPNWSLPLPVPAEAVIDSPLAASIAATLDASVRAPEGAS